ncbi:NAD(P)-dependent oxidoreductase [Pseudonocardia sp.]|jgi:3-hydroxyisobutyrate dehydrogenase|uniref:NAD(P)-dependent oxidoreductase n=1 Tax=Pseudonocardia sp. TaxID=60912 RepID=UPI0031FDE2E4
MPTPDPYTSIGFIGLGSLGAPLARNLAAAGYTVTGHDANEQAVTRLTGDGVAGAGSAEQVGRRSTVVFTCVRSSADLEQVLSGPAGLLSGLAPGSAVLDLSTLSPEASAFHAEAIEAAGSRYLRVAVSGSAAAAAARQVSFICSGPQDLYESSGPLLDALGRSRTHVGEGDEARSIKIAVNMLVGIGLAALVEAVALADGLGIDRRLFLDVVEQSAVGSPFVSAKATALVERDYTPAASLALMLKDLDLALDAGRATKLTLPVTELAQKLYNECRERGWAERDFACIAELYESPAG